MTDDDAGPSDAPTTGDPSAPVGCSGSALCADFEDQTGAALRGGWSQVAPDCSGDGKVAIDDRVVHGGQRALRISSSGGYCNHVFAAPELTAAAFAGSLWVRWYVRFGDALADGHVTFLALHDGVTGKDLRMGSQSRVLMWNRESDDATLPELSPKGIALSAAPSVGSWQCIEVHLDGATGQLESYLNGTLLHGLVIDETPTADIDGQWLRPGKWTAQLSDLRLGWESYGGQPMTLWIDDVAIGPARPGC